MASGTHNFVLYDVAFASPCEENTCAPNPWKARYALNFKDVAYKTEWVQMPDITKIRKALGVPPCRKFADGTDFYTLPILVTDTKTGSALGDSFDIANYLQDKFPDAGAGDLFPKQNLEYTLPNGMDILVPLSERNDDIHPDYVRFQSSVDMAFSIHAQLTANGMRWDPEVEGEVKAEFLRRVGMMSWEDFNIDGEAREKLMNSLRDTIERLSVLLKRDTSGPFMLGTKPSYADIIVGGWLRMLSKTLLESEWEQAKGWYDGVFGKLHAALQERFGDVK